MNEQKRKRNSSRVPAVDTFRSYNYDILTAAFNTLSIVIRWKLKPNFYQIFVPLLAFQKNMNLRKYPQSGRCYWKFGDEVPVTRIRHWWRNGINKLLCDRIDFVKVTTHPRASSEKTQSKLFGGTRKIEPTRSSNVEGIEGPKFAIARGCSAKLQPLVVALNDGKYPASRLISCKHSRLLQLSALKAPDLKRCCKASVRMADGSPSVLYCDS